jgi:hypothetical protein
MQRIMRYNRNFFVNLRFFAKLAPFRILHSTVQEAVKTRTRDSFSQILFYVKPNLRLLLLIFVISKVKQRHIVDAFRRIYGFYNGMLIHDDPSLQNSKIEKESDNGNKSLMNNFMEHIQSDKHINNLMEPNIFNNQVEKSSGSSSIKNKPQSFGVGQKTFNFNANMNKKKSPEIVKKSDNYFAEDLSNDHTKNNSNEHMVNVFKKLKKNFFEDASNLVLFLV